MTEISQVQDSIVEDHQQTTETEPRSVVTVGDATAVSMDVDQHASKRASERKPREPSTLVHVPGKSIFPVTRVQRILKADKELPMVSKEAVMLISLATEEFIRRISEASHRLAARENRLTVQRKDIASVCRRADEFFFLEELIPLYEPPAATRRKPKVPEAKDAGDAAKTSIAEQLVRKADHIPAPTVDEDIVMAEDGTMTLDSI